ncbi:lactosylceramide 4-alpha-galactosyltransferase [Thomomys bottae]
MSAPPGCLRRLRRGPPGPRVCAWILLGLKLALCLSGLVYWSAVGEPGRPPRPGPPRPAPCAPRAAPRAAPDAPAPRTIFFLETSERTDPGFLFTCSVESAARAHPEARVAVLMRGLPGGAAPPPPHLGTALLSCFPNVQLRRLDLEALFRGTPLAAWHAAGRGRWRPYALPVLSDAARIALLWKFGGVYLDWDFIVLRSLANLSNALGTQSRYVLNGAFLAFERGHDFLALCMRDFVAHYNGWIWGHQGPQLLTRVFKRWCAIRSLRDSHACRGVTALPREAFYPIPWQAWEKYFEEVSPGELARLLNASYAVHLWNEKSRGRRLRATSNALLAQLHARYCPTTHEAMKRFS